MERIGARRPTRHYLREWREKKQLTQQQVADRIGTGKDQVSRFENYKRAMTLDAAAAFASALDIDTLAIFRDPETPSVDELLNKASPDQRRQAIAVIETLLKTAS
jgi:transcriptional regulator with XRE-family HTH domain